MVPPGDGSSSSILDNTEKNTNNEGKDGAGGDDNGMDDSSSTAGLTEDEVAEKLLSQFPPYGTNKKNPLWEMNDDGNVAGNQEEDASKYRRYYDEFESKILENKLHPALNPQQQTVTGHDHPSNHRDGAVGSHGPSASAAGAVSPTSAASPLARGRFGWDPEEEYLWKTTTVPLTKGTTSGVGGGASSTTAATTGTLSMASMHTNGSTIETNKAKMLSSSSSAASASSAPSGTAAPRQRSIFDRAGGEGLSFVDTTGDNVRSGIANRDEDRDSSNTTLSTTLTLDVSSNEPSERAILSSDRQHWMPDKLCKQCYACDLPFTVFRRRHHCRLCGQVFCSNCSSYFVTDTTTNDSNDSSKNNNKNSDKNKQNKKKHGNNSNIGSNKIAGERENANRKGDSNQHTDGNKHNAKDDKNNGSRERRIRKTSRACELCYDTVQRQREQEEKQQREQQKTDESPVSSPSGSPSRDVSLPNRQLQNHHTPAYKPRRHGGVVLDPMMQPQHQLHHADSHQHQQQQQPSYFPTPCDARETALVAASHSEFHVDQAIGRAAATHLRKMGESLLESDAPRLWKTLTPAKKRSWVNTIMTLVTKCCMTVDPNTQRGDLLDIRPYVKIKVIPGGSSQKDCAYLSGVAFRKQVAHKQMAKELLNPKILLLNGGIEFTRQENRIASLETLLEQEEKYMEILVSKILKLQPTLLLVGRSVSRKAQELLLQANVVLLQHVKPHLLQRIARQTGATVLSSTDHVMNKFGVDVLGKCRRFRIVTFRDNEVWMDTMDTLAGGNRSGNTNRGIVATTGRGTLHNGFNDIDSTQAVTDHARKSIPSLLQDDELPHHERQAALAASKLGESVLDGTEAIKTGLAKRGVARSYVLLEGCPKHLGCSVVLRGASRASLKQVKRVFRFLVNVAYNLRLETSYLRERCVRLPLFVEEPRHLHSSSLCVDYGNPQPGRKVRPWNGGPNVPNKEPSLSGKISAFDHQAILITSVWMTEKTQCCPAEVKGICYYSQQDVSLGHFLRDSCFNLSLKCQNPSCKKSVLDHSLSFVHNDGLINITVEHMDDPLPPAQVRDGGANGNKTPHGHKYPNGNNSSGGGSVGGGTRGGHTNGNGNDPVATWTYCTTCQKVVTPLVYISSDTWKFSFGKFLEVSFYNRDATMNCGCKVQDSSVLYFGCGRLAARFTHESVKPYNVFVRKHLAVDPSFHRTEALKHLEIISAGSSGLFVKFDKHIEKVSREARELFGSAANKPEHLQTVLQELNLIGSEVDHASKTLQEKIASVTNKCRSLDIVNDALFRFPSYCRRYLYMLTSAWNERLSAAGQALAAMKKLAITTPMSNMIRTDSANAIILDSGSTSTEDLMEGMRRLRMLSEYYSNMKDMGSALMNPTTPTLAAPHRHRSQLSREDSRNFDDDFEDAQDDFSESVDADVLASRRRLQQRGHSHTGSNVPTSGSLSNAGTIPTTASNSSSIGNPSSIVANDNNSSNPNNPNNPSSSTSSGGNRPRKTLGTSHTTDISNSSDAGQKKSNVTAGGAVKSALTRLFNRGGKETDPYTVDLGVLKEGRPRLEPGVGGVVLPVVDEIPSTVIAYSLSSAEYAKQFNYHLKTSSHSSSATTDTASMSTTSSSQDRSGGGKSRSSAKHGQDGSSTSTEEQSHLLPHSASMRRSNGPGGMTSLQSTSMTKSEDSFEHLADNDRGQSTLPPLPKPQPSSDHQRTVPSARAEERKEMERRMLERNKSHIKHTFRDFDEKGQQTCKFVCTTYWATQFHMVRQAFLSQHVSSSSTGATGTTSTTGVSNKNGSGVDADGRMSSSGAAADPYGLDVEKCYAESLSSAYSWAASGGKSGASFQRTADDRFIIKCISRTELQMFLDCALHYFEYLSNAFFHGL